MALTTKHAQLLKSNRALLLTFEGFSVTTKLSAVGVALALGVGGGIQALKGTASDTVQACIRNRQQTLQCADKSGKPYTMTNYHVQQWIENGVPGEVVFKKSVPATNPHKTLWMLLSACSFGAAGVGLRSLQNSERQLATYEAIAQKRDLAKGEIAARGELLDDYRGVAISEVHLQADLEAAANDRAVVLKQCEVLGEADIKIAQLDAEEAIFEAETAGLSDDKKQEYMEFLRNQKTPFLLSGTQTLAGITDPSDKVSDRTASAIEPEQADGPKIPKLIWYPSVLIYGAPGSGKTHFAEQEVGKRLAAGHRVIVLDPHAAYGAWQGCEVIGGGMNYLAIDAKLAWFAEEVAKRYKVVQSQPNPKFQPLTFICDEFTRWGGKCPNSTDFFEQLVTDIRKVEMFGLIISHTRTLAGLANAKGFASLRDEALLEVEILGNKDEETGRATPRFEAKIKLPGQPLSDRTLVKLVKHPTPKNATVDDVPIGNTPNTSENSGTPKNTLEPEPEQPGSLMEQREHFSEMLEQLLTGTAEKAVFAADSPLEQEDKMKLAKLVIAQELGQEKTIWLLWGVRRGGRNHNLYTEAREMLDRLIKGDENAN